MISSVFLKLFEYCMLLKIQPYIVLNDRQHGFRKSYSTATACFILKETVMNYTHSGSNVYGCFLDISKAFDSVNHCILINQLHKLGVPANLVNMIEFWYANQFVNVRYKNILSNEWKIGNGVRQGGVLSGLLFNVYIDSLLNRISKMNVGCKLDIFNSNIIAYADDIVLLAPSANALRLLLKEISISASELKLSFNYEKSKIMIFCSNKRKNELKSITRFEISEHYLEVVKSIKYLGYIISDQMDYIDDINRVKSKFYAEFNMILRNFNFADSDVKVFLFKHYCIQLYGSELWYGLNSPTQQLKCFAVGYHKAVKKLLGVSMHESNHFACQETNLLLFNHLINKLKIGAFYRFMLKPCQMIQKAGIFLRFFSVMAMSVVKILYEEYDIPSLYDNDIDAIFSRIQYKQNHEAQMREAW